MYPSFFFPRTRIKIKIKLGALHVLKCFLCGSSHKTLKVCYNLKKLILCEEPYEEHVRKYTYILSLK